jgi:hypothetical protein
VLDGEGMPLHGEVGLIDWMGWMTLSCNGVVAEALSHAHECAVILAVLRVGCTPHHTMQYAGLATE